jgi:hypothetical protein
MSYVYKNLDIDVTQAKDDCTIRIIDMKFFRTYQKTFNDYTIQSYGVSNLNNFYKLCTQCIEALDSDDSQGNAITITKDELTLNVSYNELFVFEFELQIPLTDEATITSDQMIIQKLTTDLDKKTKQISGLQERSKWLEAEIDDMMHFMEVSVCKFQTQHHNGYLFIIDIFIPIMSPKVVINRGGNLPFVDGAVITMPNLINYHLHANFKRVRCDELEINAHAIGPSFTENIPKSVKKLVFTSCQSMSTMAIAHMTNLEELHFINCADFKHINEFISTLNVQRVTVKNCPLFSDANILTQRGIEVTMI